MTTDETWLTVTDLARRLGRPASTVKYWRDTHRAILPERVDRSGHPTYRLSTFERIAALMADGAGRVEVVRAILEDGPVPPEGFEQAVLSRLDRIADALDRIADYFDANEPPER